MLLEIARQLSQVPSDIGVDIAFFDAEDYGVLVVALHPNGYDCAKVSVLGANPHRPGHRARFGILLDMVGASDAVFHQEGTSLRLAPHVAKGVETGFDLGFEAAGRADPADDRRQPVRV